MCVCSAFLVAVCASRTPADTTMTFTLKDGSILRGEVVGFSEGTYAVRTTHLGTVDIQETDILRMSAEGKDALSPRSGEVKNQMATMQKQILSDRDIMGDIMSLAQDPELMELLSDPQLADALMSFDLERLQGHPKFQKLMDHPKLRNVVEKAGRKTGVAVPPSPETRPDPGNPSSAPSSGPKVIYHDY